MSWQDNNLTNKRLMKNLEHKFAVFYFPSKNIDISVISENKLLEISSNKYASYTFVDIKSCYKYKKAAFELTINNILNNKQYSRFSYSSVNSMYQEVPLRGREILLSASVNFP